MPALSLNYYMKLAGKDKAEAKKKSDLLMKSDLMLTQYINRVK